MRRVPLSPGPHRIVVSIAVLCLSTAIVAAGEPRRVTDDGRLKRDPIYWPDGRSVVYTVEQPSGRMKLVRQYLDDDRMEFVHPDENLSDRELTVADDGKVFAYNVVTGGKGIDTQIRIARADSPAVLRAPVKGWSHWPTISPGGRRLVFSENGHQLYLFHVDFDERAHRIDLPSPEAEKGGKKDKKKDPKSQALAAGTLEKLASGMWPRFSPDGLTLAYVSTEYGDLEICVLDLASRTSTRLTERRGIDARPVWSPDGKRIAFTSHRDGQYDLYVMQADGSGVQRVTEHPERDDFAVWHPSGRELLFVGERNGSLDLFAIDVPQAP